MSKQDIITAQQLVSGLSSNLKQETFHETSIIYKSTNERPVSYQHYIKGKQDILSVIASGDQIINAMLEEPKSITGFDISTFPKYFLYLKLAGILSLTKEEYIDFFFETPDTSERYDDLYDRIRENLSEDNKEFWDSLFNYFDWYDIYTSSLFSSEVVIPERVIERNTYLQDENYEKLKQKLPGISLKTKTGNIFSMSFDNDFDFINLSNIIYYNNPDEYKKLLTRLPLKLNGEVLTYIYKVNSQLKEYFSDEDISFEQFHPEEPGVMIYTKKRQL